MIGGAFIAWLILVMLFTPHIPYHIEADLDATSDHLVEVIESTCLTQLHPGNKSTCSPTATASTRRCSRRSARRARR